MKPSPITTFEVISSWIASAITEDQLDVLSLFVLNTFTVQFPRAVNEIYGEMRADLLAKIEAKRPGCHVHEYVEPVNDSNGH